MQYIRAQLGYSSCLVMPAKGKSGGLALLWNTDVTITLHDFSPGHIDVRIDQEGLQSWRFTGFYGNPDAGLRKFSWDLLQKLSKTHNLPWLVGGDFNEIFYSYEKDGGNDRSYASMSRFRAAVEDCELSDLGYHGSPFTWRNKEQNSSIRERLDRGLANIDWKSMFPHSHVFHLTTFHSDHSPVLISDEGAVLSKPTWKNLPRFDPFWLKDDECEKVFKSLWDTSKALTSATLSKDVRFIRDNMRTWAREKFGAFSKRMTSLQKELDSVICNSHYDVSREKELLEEIEKVSLLEEEFWRTRGKVDWLTSTDKNTSFFHHKANSRRERNTIWELLDEEGNSFSQLSDLKRIASTYFNSVYTSNGNQEQLPSDIEFKQLSEADISMLSRPFSASEIQAALKQMTGKKSPGPDGMHMTFLQKFWNIVGAQVSTFILSCLNEGKDFQSLNQTFIVLIPKKKNAICMMDFRPISLCNSIYKLISRTLANRLKKITSLVISTSQSAFVKGRLISDNIISAFEVFHSMQKGDRGSSKHMALKIDMMKAFDRVEWGFLEQVMRAMKFPNSIIQLTMQCVTTVTYQVLINGHPSSTIRPTRGIRQGDPLSPFLFIICAEGLSAMIRQAQLHQQLKGVRFGSGNVELSHLLFADDCMIFAEATIESCSTIRDILEDYELFSGQKVNLQKSSMFFSNNLREDLKNELSTTLGIPFGSDKGKYLGLPFVIGRSKTEIFAYIKERVAKKLNGWKGKILSPAGKEVLIKAVIQDVPQYVMQCFLLPKTLINEIEKMVRRFFWGGTGGENKIQWKSWSLCCKKKSDGGVGFRDLECFNAAMLAKQAWKILREPNTILSSILKAKYFPRKNFMSATLSSSPSAIWRGILHGRDLLSKGLRWRVGNGDTINITGDPWLPITSSFYAHPTAFITTDQKVSSLIHSGTRQWNETLVNTTFNPYEAEKVLSIPLSPTSKEDKMIWHFSKNGIYTVRSGYHLAFQIKSAKAGDQMASSSSATGNKFWTSIWNMKVKPRVTHFVWKAAHNALPTSVGLARRGMGNNMCKICNEEPETTWHCLFECWIPKAVWKAFEDGNYWRYLMPTCMKDVFDFLFSKEDDGGTAVITNIIWAIWKARCAWIFEGKSLSVSSLILKAKSEAMEYFQAFTASKMETEKPAWQLTWQPPPWDYVKFNVDAAFHSGITAVGGLIRDSCGNILQAFSKKIGG